MFDLRVLNAWGVMSLSNNSEVHWTHFGAPRSLWLVQNLNAAECRGAKHYPYMVAPQGYDFSDLVTVGVLNINHSNLEYKGITSFCLVPSCDCVHMLYYMTLRILNTCPRILAYIVR